MLFRKRQQPAPAGSPSLLDKVLAASVTPKRRLASHEKRRPAKRNRRRVRQTTPALESLSGVQKLSACLGAICIPPARTTAALLASLALPRGSNHARRKSKHRRQANVFYEALEIRDMLSVTVTSVAQAPEGSALTFTIEWQSGGPGQLSWGTYGGTAVANIDYTPVNGSENVGASGTLTVAVGTKNDGGDPDHGKTVELDVQYYSTMYGTADANGTGNITEDPGTPTNCTCSCSCGNVEATFTTQTGRLLVNSGQGPQPNDFYYVGDQQPHPIATVNDTLSSSISQASDIVVQTTLDDLSGNVLYTATPVYYSASGYTAGQQVQFSQMLDASGLADGTYQYTMTVSEEYPNSLPVIRSYTDFVAVHNLDSSPDGSGWTLKNVDRLVPQSMGASLEDGSGNVYYFGLTNSGTYDVPDNRPDVASLVKNGDGSFTVAYRDGGQEEFASTGLLAADVDKNGNRTSYQWNPDGALASTTNQSGQQTTFSYTGGLLTSVKDFAGRVTSYGYSGGQLTSISLPAPGDGEQQHVTTLGYDPNTGMLTTITDAGGTTTLAYNAFREVSGITEPDGTVTHDAPPDSLSLVDTSSGLGTQSDPAPLVYTANVRGSVTDGNGHTSYDTTAQYGEITSTTDATGQNTTTYQYNNAGQVTQMVQPPLTSGGQTLVTSMQYDANGNLDLETFPDGSSESWVYNQTFNEPTKFVDAAGRETDYTLDPNNGDVLTVTQVGQNGDPNLVTTYTYTPNPTAQGQTPGGLVATMVDPRGIETEYFYNSAGLTTSIVYAVGTPDQASVSFTYDANDNLASYTNDLGLTTNYTFDNSNRLVEQQDPPPDPNDPSVRPTWTYVYDTRGNLLSETDPMLRTTSYVYGAGSDGDEPDLDQVIAPDPNGGTNYTVTTYGHDNADNVTSITDPLSRLETIGLDADNRQTSVTLPNPVGGGSGGPTESVVYNALGMPVQEFDLLGGETDNTFNWRGQTLTTTGPAPTQGAQRPTQTFTYNEDGQVLTDENALAATTQYVYNSFGWMTEEILPPPTNGASSVTLHWSYDHDGNVVSYVDGNGNTYTYEYNNRNEMVEEQEPSPDGGHTPGPVWQWQYNTAQELTETIDPMKRVTQFVLDGDGNVIQTIAPNLATGGPGDASTTTFDTYDLDNEKTSETTPDGATTSWQFNDLGQMTQETQPVPMTGGTAPVWQYQMDKDNELTQETNPLNLTQTSTFNGLGQMTSQVSFAGQETDWTYNAVGETLTSTLVAAAGSGLSNETTTNTWDALGRELTTTTPDGGTTTMGYNLTGAMTSLEDPDGNTTSWQVDAWNRPISETNPGNYTETFSYDANSNLTQEVDFDGQTRQFVYNDLNQETAEKWMSGGTAINTISTAYNAAGQVVSTGDNYSDYAFGYDGQGNATCGSIIAARPEHRTWF